MLNPARLADLEKIPQELKARPQWVCWRPDKTPVNPRSGGNADCSIPETWGDFSQAVEHYEAHKDNGIAGIGYEFSPGDPFTGIDLDKCRDPETGQLKFCAQVLIDYLQSYTEISPSGTGLHFMIKGKVPPGGNAKGVPCGGKVEMYSQARYFTVTGAHLERTPSTIEDRQAELEVLHLEIFGKPQAPPKVPGPAPTLDLSDRELLDLAHQARNGDKFSRLWRGDTTEYDGDDSRADLALCSMLAFWTGPDPERIDQLFHQSWLYRNPERNKKWDRRMAGSTYGAKTIDKALADITEFYTPPKGQDRPQGDPATGGQATGEGGSEAPRFQSNPFPDVISAADLENLDFPEIEYLIKDIMPFGFGLISARPKKGKSYLALNISVAKSTGGCALGKKDLRLELGTVLYIAYEDKNRRVKNRLTTIMQGEPFPQRLYVAETWPRLPDGGLDRLDKWLTSNPDARLVVIDTLGRFKPRKQSKQDDYEADLATGAALADLAHKHNVCILGVYHNRKAESDDPLDDVLGSTGMTAAADFVMVLKRGRGQADAELFVTGRDIEEKTMALRFHKSEFLWELLGTAEEVAKSQARQEICLILKENGPVTTKELSEIISKKEDTIKKMLYRMKGDNEVRFRDGKWELM